VATANPKRTVIPGGITLHGCINKFPNLGKVDDLVDLGVDFLFREPERAPEAL
jgi:hypothetical protein